MIRTVPYAPDLPGWGANRHDPKGRAVMTTPAAPPRLLIEQARRNGEWSWFCEEDGCGWSGHGWMTETGARREGERHECRAR